MYSKIKKIAIVLALAIICCGSLYLLTKTTEVGIEVLKQSTKSKQNQATSKQSVIKQIEERKKIILIDPGHGGADPGAISKSGTKEKDINLAISLKLREKFTSLGYEVKMTRDEDKAIIDPKVNRFVKSYDLGTRSKMRETTKCDLFISVHLNMFPQSKYYGAQVWYSGNDIAKQVAHKLQEDFKTELKDNNNRVEKCSKDELKVLRGTATPSILVECGFISNPTEESKLKTADYQDKVAKIIGESVDSYFKNSKVGKNTAKKATNKDKAVTKTTDKNVNKVIAKVDTKAAPKAKNKGTMKVNGGVKVIP